MAKLSIYKYVRTDKGWRYCKAAFHPNGKIKPNVVVVSGVEEKHTEGRYFLNFNNQWIDVGEDALEAQRKRLLRLNQMEYQRLSAKSLASGSAGGPSVVEFIERKVTKDEVEAYLANLELAKRPHKTVQSKRRFLTWSPPSPGACSRDLNLPQSKASNRSLGRDSPALRD